MHCIALQCTSGVEDMRHQLTVRLPEDLHKALRAAARRMQRKSSDIVRLALREFLGAPTGGRNRPADRVQALIGSIESGVPDLADKHRAYVIESLRRGR
jgi:Ribbon-helix-helix protein, copG family